MHYSWLALSIAVIIVSTSAHSGTPQPISPTTQRGIDYLINQQGQDGGWGQGGGWRQSAGGGRVEQVQGERSDVGNTALAGLALIRAGNTPKRGQHARSVGRAVEFVCKSVDRSDPNSLYVTDIHDTQIQMKIGRYVDTFLSSQFLAEVKGEMPDAAGEQRLGACLDKVIAKIEKNQRDDGTFAGNDGWASVLSQGMATRSLNTAKQKGAKVQEKTLANAQKQAVANYDEDAKSFRASASPAASDAGVGLYGASAGASSLATSIATAERDEAEAKRVAADPKAKKEEREEARSLLDRLGKARNTQREMTKTMVQQISDDRFISGFGSNGGEEFLSYMNISETLLIQNDPTWPEWHAKMNANLARIQNTDGSWSGHHCITGRTFVTAAALLTVLADRATGATSSQLRRG
jgi:hypothetical protein